MNSDKDVSEDLHRLERTVTEKRRRGAEVYTIDGEIVLSEEAGGELIDIVNEGRWECSCGEKFNSDNTALRHLEETDSLERAMPAHDSGPQQDCPYCEPGTMYYDSGRMVKCNNCGNTRMC